MRTGTWCTPTALIFASGLLVLAGVFADTRPALAQTPLDCPLPAGVTPPADPRVTAQQVEDGSASLMDFALAVRERSREHARQATSVQQGQYIGCIIRQEGSPWRSGSTYIVTLTPDGRLYIHAKDMALSGRLLNPVIYAEVLSALGVSPTDLANLASPDPGTAALALQAVFATLSQEPDGAFDATVSIPGASGHAVVYVSPELGAPIVLLAGFDLNESHLVSIDDETIDYGDPTVTARDVVDRETLKAFVTQAGNFFLEIMSAGDAAAASKVRIALRDPNGPWRHGSVYLGVLQPATNLILFHGAFPDRFELRQAGISRDAVTGELIVDQIIAAAESGPEGGFWLYHFDDPADDTDSDDIPKVGYARVFSGQIPGPGGTTIPTDFIIHSGFYLGSDGSGGLAGRLENPAGPHSFQSGVSALWGWVCEAAMVEIEIETAQGEVTPYLAEYGLERSDTLDTCGDTDNGFVLLFNWNRLGAGEHTVTALVDGLELGRATVQVTTVGEGDQEEFLQGAVGECVAGDFPLPGQTTTLEWQQSQQNFVITEVE